MNVVFKEGRFTDIEVPTQLCAWVEFYKLNSGLWNSLPSMWQRPPSAVNKVKQLATVDKLTAMNLGLWLMLQQDEKSDVIFWERLSEVNLIDLEAHSVL